MHSSQRCVTALPEAVPHILGHANIHVTQNVYGRRC
jgi:hypothetical protein